MSWPPLFLELGMRWPGVTVYGKRASAGGPPGVGPSNTTPGDLRTSNAVRPSAVRHETECLPLLLPVLAMARANQLHNVGHSGHVHLVWSIPSCLCDPATSPHDKMRAGQREGERRNSPSSRPIHLPTYLPMPSAPASSPLPPSRPCTGESRLRRSIP